MKKVKYLLKYPVQFILTIVFLSLIIFYMARLAPGNPLRSYYGESIQRMSLKEQEAAKERLGLNQPIYKQYGKWVKEAFKGEFGISYKYKKDAIEVLKEVYPNTVLLGGVSFFLTFAGAILFGALCTLKEGSFWDRFICKAGVIFNCIPAFWTSIVFILIFSVWLKILPSGGAYSIGLQSDFIDRMKHLILPVTVLVLGHIWYYAYLVRNRLLEEVRKDYVLMCKSKGLTRNKILFCHCMRNILPFFVGLMAVSIPHILAGTYVVEKVFSYPGLGTICFESAKYHDYNMLMVVSMISGIIVVTINMAAHILMEKIDPSMGVGQEELD